VANALSRALRSPAFFGRKLSPHLLQLDRLTASSRQTEPQTPRSQRWLELHFRARRPLHHADLVNAR